jgi:hypothetical protein
MLLQIASTTNGHCRCGWYDFNRRKFTTHSNGYTAGGQQLSHSAAPAYLSASHALMVRNIGPRARPKTSSQCMHHSAWGLRLQVAITGPRGPSASYPSGCDNHVLLTLLWPLPICCRIQQKTAAAPSGKPRPHPVENCCPHPVEY